jgi:hypothetical protein
MDKTGPLAPNGGREKRKPHTEGIMVAVGFAIILVVGGLLMWRIYGLEFALLGVSVIIAVIVLFLAIWMVLKALETWAKS